MKKQNWISFLAGAIVGTGITWLLTSKKGKEFVEDVKKKATDMLDIEDTKPKSSEPKHYTNQN